MSKLGELPGNGEADTAIGARNEHCSFHVNTQSIRYGRRSTLIARRSSMAR